MSDTEEKHPAPTFNFSKSQLKDFVARIESIDAARAELSDDMRSLLGEIRAAGFDTVVLRSVVNLRKQDSDEWRNRDSLRELYLHALGMIAEPGFDFSGITQDDDSGEAFGDPPKPAAKKSSASKKQPEPVA